MLGTSAGLELSEMVLSKHSNPEEGMAASSKDASSSGASTESLGIESRPCLKSLTLWCREK